MKWSRFLSRMLAVLLPLLALWLGWRGWSWAHWHPFNDPLLDRFARLTRDQIAAADRRQMLQLPAQLLSKKQPKGQVTPQLDLSALTSWEGEFGGDPHYWELYADFIDGRTALKQCLARDELSPAMLGYGRHMWVDELDPGHALQLCDRCITLEPDNSYFYYARCDLQLMHQDYAGALQSCRLGNATVLNERTRAFWWDKAEEATGATRDPALQAVCGAWRTSFSLPGYLKERKLIDALAPEIKAGRQLELADALWTRGNRETLMTRNLMLECMTSFTKPIHLIKTRKGGFNLELSGPQLAELEELRRRRGEYTALVREMNKQYVDMNDYAKPQWAPASNYFRAAWRGDCLLLDRHDDMVRLLDAVGKAPLEDWAAGRLAGYLSPEEAEAAAAEALATHRDELQRDAATLVKESKKGSRITSQQAAP